MPSFSEKIDILADFFGGISALAEKLGVHRETIRKWRMDRPKDRIIIGIATTLGVSTEELLDDSMSLRLPSGPGKAAPTSLAMSARELQLEREKLELERKLMLLEREAWIAEHHSKPAPRYMDFGDGKLVKIEEARRSTDPMDMIFAQVEVLELEVASMRAALRQAGLLPEYKESSVQAVKAAEARRAEWKRKYALPSVDDLGDPVAIAKQSQASTRTETHHGAGKNSGNTNSGGGSQVVGDGAFVSTPGGSENEYLRAAKATRDPDAFLAAFPALKLEFARLLADRSIAAAEAVRRAASFCGYPDGIPVAILTHLNKAARKARNI